MLDQLQNDLENERRWKNEMEMMVNKYRVLFAN